MYDANLQYDFTQTYEIEWNVWIQWMCRFCARSFRSFRRSMKIKCKITYSKMKQKIEKKLLIIQEIWNRLWYFL